ncbi:hypothetical protein BOX15_Mlig034166g1, partial [Macrostomum lignano]
NQLAHLTCAVSLARNRSHKQNMSEQTQAKVAQPAASLPASVDAPPPKENPWLKNVIASAEPGPSVLKKDSTEQLAEQQQQQQPGKKRLAFADDKLASGGAGDGGPAPVAAVADASEDWPSLGQPATTAGKEAQQQQQHQVVVAAVPKSSGPVSWERMTLEFGDSGEGGAGNRRQQQQQQQRSRSLQSANRRGGHQAQHHHLQNLPQQQQQNQFKQRSRTPPAGSSSRRIGGGGGFSGGNGGANRPRPFKRFARTGRGRFEQQHQSRMQHQQDVARYEGMALIYSGGGHGVSQLQDQLLPMGEMVDPVTGARSVVVNGLYYYPENFDSDAVCDVVFDQIRRQIEFYFSDDNLNHDLFLRSIMDKEGFVCLQTLAGFNRVNYLCNGNPEDVLAALEKSDQLELSADRTRVRRRVNPTLWPIDLDTYEGGTAGLKDRSFYQEDASHLLNIDAPEFVPRTGGQPGDRWHEVFRRPRTSRNSSNSASDSPAAAGAAPTPAPATTGAPPASGPPPDDDELDFEFSAERGKSASAASAASTGAGAGAPSSSGGAHHHGGSRRARVRAISTTEDDLTESDINRLIVVAPSGMSLRTLAKHPGGDRPHHSAVHRPGRMTQELARQISDGLTEYEAAIWKQQE